MVVRFFQDCRRTVEHPSCRLICRTNSLSTCLPDYIRIKQTPKGSTLISQSAKSVCPEGIEPSSPTYQVSSLPLEEGHIKTGWRNVHYTNTPPTVATAGVGDQSTKEHVGLEPTFPALYRRRDSNPHCPDFELGASYLWATSA